MILLTSIACNDFKGLGSVPGFNPLYKRINELLAFSLFAILFANLDHSFLTHVEVIYSSLEP